MKFSNYLFVKKKKKNHEGFIDAHAIVVLVWLVLCVVSVCRFGFRRCDAAFIHV